MPKNIELIQRMFGSKEPIPSIELAYNALKLGGIAANLYALKSDLNGQVEILLGNIQDVIDELEEHKDDDVRHLTQTQIDKINDAINAATALQIANRAINDAKDSIIASAVGSATSQSKDYTDTTVNNAVNPLNTRVSALETGKQNALTFDTTPTQNSTNPVTSGGIYNALQTDVLEREHTDPVTGETDTQTLDDALVDNPQTRINPECFFRFKNMMDNSSVEVLDGNTNIPLGWDNGIASEDASMFGTRSLKLTTGQTAKQTAKFQASWQWFKDNVYNTSSAIFCFYHKFDAVKVKIYDVTNEEYMNLTLVKQDLTEEQSTTEIIFTEDTNWSQYRCMVKFTPKNNTTYIRPEFTCMSGSNGSCFVDAFMMEPFVSGEFPSIYKDGRYSVAAYQILNPPPGDVDRFTSLEHFTIANPQYDARGNITSQDLLRSNNTLAIHREVDANSVDANGYYQTIVEKFYKADGVTVNYVDTWSFTYTPTGAILTASKTTTET